MRVLMSVLLLACVGGHPGASPSGVAGEPASAPAGTEAEPGPAPPPPPGVKVAGNVPVRTEAELEELGKARETCLDTCLRERQAEALSIELIEADCQAFCLDEHPVEQVEIAPSLSPGVLPDG